MFEPSSSPALNNRSAYKKIAAAAMSTTPGGETVDPVDEVHRVRQHDDGDHGDERREVGREHDVLVAGERDAEVEHRDAEERQHAAAQHLTGDLGRG